MEEPRFHDVWTDDPDWCGCELGTRDGAEDALTCPHHRQEALEADTWRVENAQISEFDFGRQVGVMIALRSEMLNEQWQQAVRTTNDSYALLAQDTNAKYKLVESLCEEVLRSMPSLSPSVRRTMRGEAMLMIWTSPFSLGTIAGSTMVTFNSKSSLGASLLHHPSTSPSTRSLWKRLQAMTGAKENSPPST